MAARPSLVSWVVAVLAAACAPAATDKLAELKLDDAGRAALGRLRFAHLRSGDHLLAGDLVLCGGGDRVLLGFSKTLVRDFLGRDSDWLIPELFTASNEGEVFLEVPEGQVLRLALPRGIGGTGEHPEAWVRELKGSPLFTSDARAVAMLFFDGEQEELFALRANPASPGELTRRQAEASLPASRPTLHSDSTALRTPAPAIVIPSGATWRLGVSVFPRMGPQRGVVIASVVAGSPAAVSGLEPGDRILSVNGAAVGSFQELKRLVSDTRGAELALDVTRRRGGAKGNVSEWVRVPLSAR